MMSFIYSRNNTSPKIEPRGAPDKTGLGEGWERFNKNALIHDSIFPLIP